MSGCFCDVRANKGAKNLVAKPNFMSGLAARVWHEIPVAHAAIAEIQSVLDARVYFYPSEKFTTSSPVLTATYEAVGGKYGFLPYPELWYVWYDSATASATFDLNVLDFPNGCAARAYMQTGGYTVAAHSQVTLNTGAAQTVLAANAARKYALIQNNGTGPARFRWDGTAPTAAIGIQLLPGASYPFEGPELYRGLIKGIEVSGTPVIDVVEGV